MLAGCSGGGSGGGDATNGSSPIATTLGASSITPTGAVLNGTVIPNGLPTQSWFEYGTDSALGAYSTSTKQDEGNGLIGQTSNLTWNGLAAGTTYYFRFCAENGKGSSKGAIVGFTTASSGGSPTVATLAATSVGATAATLNGTVIPNGLATTAWFEWGTDPALTTYTTTPAQSAGAGTASVPVGAALSGLSTGAAYYCRIAAINGSGTSKGSIVSLTPGAAPAVTTLAATAVGSATATLNGNATPNGLATNAWFEYGTDPDLFSSVSTPSQPVGSGTTSQSVNAVLTGLTDGTTYYYRIAAGNSSGTGRGSILSFVPAAAPPISLQIKLPSSGAVVDTTFKLGVAVTSQYQQAGVTVRVDNGPELPLAYTDEAYCGKIMCFPGWAATVSLAGMAKGNHVLLVTARDVFGNAGSASVVVAYDQKPVVSVQEPLNYTVARPSIHVKAACTDDDPAGCASIRVDVEGTAVFAGKDSIDQDISLATWEGAQPQMCVTGKDSANQETTACRSVFVESSTRLAEIASVSGTILDVDADRILFLDGGDLKIRQRTSGAETTLLTPAQPWRAFLSPLGAIWVNQPGSSTTAALLEWRNGAVTDLGFPNSGSSLVVAGKYAIWCNSPNLYLRDLEAGTTSTVSTAAGNVENDVTADGVVAWWGSGDYQVRLGSRQITFGPERNVYPRTDGVNVVYRKGPPENTSTYLNDGSSEIRISPTTPGPAPQYLVANGYVAFMMEDAGAVDQVHLRSPTGTRQLSIFGSDSALETLAPDGSLTFRNRNARYLDTSTNKVGSGLGRAVRIEGVWHVVVGRSLFRVQ